MKQAKGREKAIRISYKNGKNDPIIQIFEPSNSTDVGRGTVAGFKATCPKCHQVIPRQRVQAQLRQRRGGTDDAILLAVVRQDSNHGKDYFASTPDDMEAIQSAKKKARNISIEMPSAPPGGDTGFRPRGYGVTNWGELLTPRQTISRWIIHGVMEDAITHAGETIQDQDLLDSLAACLYAAFSDNSQYHTSLCVWLSEGVKSIFIQGSGVPMRADFVEGSPLSPNCEGLAYSIKSASSALRGLINIRHRPSTPLLANALDPILPDESVDIVFTDPPYANQIPYAHLSDFFLGWLKLGLARRMPLVLNVTETDKAREITENRSVSDGGVHDREWYEHRMKEAFLRIRSVVREDGIASVIFAHKDTDRWESLVSALISAGWRTTSSWPIATERRTRMRGQGFAALETSVHLVCRPRPEDAPVGDWNDVHRELPIRVADWMERLQSEGVRGADLVFACIGPALEIYSRYSRVVDAEDREIPLGGDPEAKEPYKRGYLAYVWEVVGRAALEQVLGTAEARARNGAAGALEEDARLTALFLWTLQSTNGARDEGGKQRVKDEKEEESYEEETEEEEGAKTKKKGLTLIYDVARRFAQPLGIHLDEWEGRIIEIEKGIVRLLPVNERAKQLFGEESADAVAAELEENPERAQQLQLAIFPEEQTAAPELRIGKGRRKTLSANVSDDSLRPRREATTLDRVHAAMLLQKSGHTNALRAMLKAEIERAPDFLRLANSLSALYPRESEEKRLLDAMLLAVPR